MHLKIYDAAIGLKDMVYIDGKCVVCLNKVLMTKPFFAAIIFYLNILG